jgi:hypothetical protein
MPEFKLRAKAAKNLYHIVSGHGWLEFTVAGLQNEGDTFWELDPPQWDEQFEK